MSPVWDRPASIVMELSEFSFIPFNGTKLVISLNQLLILMSEESYFTCFPEISNVIARDITSAIAYFHGKDIVHKDVKPENILVSNSHYSNLQEVDLKVAYEKAPTECKLGSLESDRCMELLITFFVILNPDQRFPFHFNIKENAPTDLADQAFNGFLRKRIISEFGKDNLPFEADNYQQLRLVFCEELQYDPKKICNVDKIKEMIAAKEHNISYAPLNCSQVTALDKSDKIVAK